ncbi:MAG TPA: hypothetical protein VI893_11075 [Thermoplasmata archaeon]|nr:hypothetical protein [Thermoplasmata archaeon]
MGFGRDLGLILVEDEQGSRFDLRISRSGGLETVESDDCALQSILGRVATRRGELSRLGHADYGSLLDEFVGRPLDSASLRAIESLVRECLAGEPRITETLAVSAREASRTPGTVDLEVDVRIDNGRRLRVSWSLAMGG